MVIKDLMAEGPGGYNRVDLPLLLLLLYPLRYQSHPSHMLNCFAIVSSYHITIHHKNRAAILDIHTCERSNIESTHNIIILVYFGIS